MYSRFFFYAVITVIFTSLNVQSQVTTQWRSVYNGSANDTDIVTSMTVDNQGNVYVTGFSKGNLTGKDIATIKYSSSGQQIWAARYDNAGKDDAANAITVDATGNIYITGYTTGLTSFKDYITIKYSSSGNLLWSSMYNGKGNDDDLSSAIAVDGLGNVFVTGYSVGLTSSEDYLTIKYNSAGNEQWINSYDNPDMDDIDIANSMILDGTGNIYVTGYSIGNGSAEDYATVKYNSAGNEQWVRRYSGTGNDYDITTGIAVDGSGNIIVTGYSVGNSSAEDYATVKYDPQGNSLWVNRYNGASNSYDIATSIAADSQGNAYVTGYSYGDLTSEDYATIKYSPEGQEEWVSKYNGTGGDFDIATSVKSDFKGDVYVTGYSYDPDTKENYATVKYNSAGVEQWTEIYNGASNGSDIASSIFSDINDNIYVTGYSYDGPNSVDYVTFKYSQTVGINQISNSIAGAFELKQNYPNPFNPVTKINYELPISNYVSLKIFDISGKEVSNLVNQVQTRGSYEVSFDASKLTSGIYFYKLETNSFSATKKMLLIK
ncbi:MAG TPA: SBBP repeat-containing protein [Ignavibacteria bacterium]|nr:SBBP repeat-containing protein [Ignavibacteria bacterium]